LRSAWRASMSSRQPSRHRSTNAGIGRDARAAGSAAESWQGIAGGGGRWNHALRKHPCRARLPGHGQYQSDRLELGHREHAPCRMHLQHRAPGSSRLPPGEGDVRGDWRSRRAPQGTPHPGPGARRGAARKRPAGSGSLIPAYEVRRPEAGRPGAAADPDAGIAPVSLAATGGRTRRGPRRRLTWCVGLEDDGAGGRGTCHHG
jgi:hypothetical protein